MKQTVFHKWFEPIKNHLPGFVSSPIRCVFTAFLTPILFSYKSGHFRSSFRKAAVSAGGDPLPWYTYPAIDFLKSRNFHDKTILEFGGGQSSLWWASRAKHTVTFEGDKAWFDQIRRILPEHMDLFLVPLEEPASCIKEINRVLSAHTYEKFDVVIIDGLFRYEMIEIARRMMKDSGAIIADDSEGYGFYEGFKNSGLARVDFFGYSPGVILPHCTSIYFKGESFLFHAKNQVPVIS